MSITAHSTRHRRRFAAAAGFTLALLVAPLALRAQATMPDAADSSVRDLPLTEVPARRAGDAVTIFLTGDGGFAELDREVAAVLADSGIAVVAFDTRAYLWRQRGPAETARDVARVARHYSALWHRDRIVVAGYSHGADLIPFVADRLPPDVASRVVLYAMLGLGPGASFQFHFADLFRDIRRPSDLPVMPELQKLRGRRMLCIYGTDEAASSCRDADSTLLDRHPVPGDHHFNRAYRAIGAMIAGAVQRR
jgi:type IV secretory pathway VirJ component